MPKEIVSDLKVFQETSIYLHKNVSIIHDKCNQSLSDANRKLEETQEELAYSKRLLEEAIAEEHRCLLEKIAREEEVAAAAAGLPETAEWYADAMRRLTIAIEEYEKAVAHRILMEQRVALANQCVCIASEMVSTLIAKYNYGQNQIGHYTEVGINRLNAANRATTSYVQEGVNNSSYRNAWESSKKNTSKNTVYCENLGNPASTC